MGYFQKGLITWSVKAYCMSDTTGIKSQKEEFKGRWLFAGLNSHSLPWASIYGEVVKRNVHVITSYLLVLYFLLFYLFIYWLSGFVSLIKLFCLVNTEMKPHWTMSKNNFTLFPSKQLVKEEKYFSHCLG